MKRSMWVVVAAVSLLGACSRSGTPGQTPAAASTAAATGGAPGDAGTAPLDQPDDVVPPLSAAQMSAQKIDQVLAGDWRPAADKARDRYRHPRQTLAFFGLRPDMHVIEIMPGGGWYARILAPLLRDNGQYVAAMYSPLSGAGAARSAAALQTVFSARPDVFDKAQIAEFDPKTPNLGAPGSADMVLTFRNVHNWVQAGTVDAMFKAFYDVLKPGGVLGVVDHRAADGERVADVEGSGYLPQAYVIKRAEQAGFRLDGESQVNANPRDSKDYPKGVWTLPPTLALGAKDKAKYLAIGESDRMTLRFVKPSAPATSASTSVATSAH